jgi:hypothetical protein
MPDGGWLLDPLHLHDDRAGDLNGRQAALDRESLGVHDLPVAVGGGLEEIRHREKLLV